MSHLSTFVTYHTVPYQDNSWDCGVFVCRYAYSTLLLRDRQFTFEDITGSDMLLEGITNRPEFEFSMQDIKLLREEMKVLVDNLTESYQSIKLKEKEDRKAEKRKAKIVIDGIHEPSGEAMVKSVMTSSTANEDQSRPKHAGKVATITEDGADHDTHDELTSVTPIMVEDKEIELKELNPNNIVTANKVDRHDENEFDVGMLEGDKVGVHASPMKEVDLPEDGCTVSILGIEDQDRSKEPILDDTVTASKVSDHDEHERVFESQMVEDKKAGAGASPLIKKEDSFEESIPRLEHVTKMREKPKPYQKLVKQSRSNQSKVCR